MYVEYDNVKTLPYTYTQLNRNLGVILNLRS